MARRDKSTIPLFIEFLCRNDMDHEVEQWEQIDKILGEHGRCPETLDLIAARLSCCHGQHGDEQVPTWWEKWELNDYFMNDAEARKNFAARVAVRCLPSFPPIGETASDLTKTIESGDLDWECHPFDVFTYVPGEELAEVLKPELENAFIELLKTYDPSLDLWDISDWAILSNPRAPMPEL